MGPHIFFQLSIEYVDCTVRTQRQSADTLDEQVPYKTRHIEIFSARLVKAHQTFIKTHSRYAVMSRCASVCVADCNESDMNTLQPRREINRRTARLLKTVTAPLHQQKAANWQPQNRHR